MLAGAYDGPLEPRPIHAAQPVVVFAGRHIPEKRVPALVPAIAAARERLPELRGVILGDGPDRALVQRCVDELELSEVIEVPGFVATEVVQATIESALCLALPSRREGYGLVVVEAAACGTPSVVVAGTRQCRRRADQRGRERVRGRLGLTPRISPPRSWPCTTPGRACGSRARPGFSATPSGCPCAGRWRSRSAYSRPGPGGSSESTSRSPCRRPQVNDPA